MPSRALAASRWIACLALLLASERAQAKRCPNVLLVVDTSAAMATAPMGGGKPPSRWQLVSLSVVDFAFQVAGRGRLGLELFSSAGGAAQACFADTSIVIPVGPVVAQQFAQALGRVAPGGLNNAGDAIRRAVQDGMLDDPQRENAILLITTGRPDCQPVDVPNAAYTISEIANAAARKVPVTTYVIGFPGADPVAAANLEAMGLAGGTIPGCMAKGVPCYFVASSAVAFQMALERVLAPLQTCDDSCFGLGCPAGQVCRFEKACEPPRCMKHLCANTVCGPGTYCLDGLCYEPCEPCGEDRVCLVGNCVEEKCTRAMRERCEGIGPPGSFVCDRSTGQCAKSLCQFAQACTLPTFCEPFTGCCNGVDPCRLVNCPAGATCYGGSCVWDRVGPDLGMPDLAPAPPEVDLEAAPDLANPEFAERGCSCKVGHGARRRAGEELGSALLGLGLVLGGWIGRGGWRRRSGRERG